MNMGPLLHRHWVDLDLSNSDKESSQMLGNFTSDGVGSIIVLVFRNPVESSGWVFLVFDEVVEGIHVACVKQRLQFSNVSFFVIRSVFELFNLSVSSPSVF